MKKLTQLFLVLCSMVLITSCETSEFDELLDNPNELDPQQMSINEGLNGLQLSLNNLFVETQTIGAQATRVEYMFGTTYQNAFGPTTGQGAWNIAYADILYDSNVLLPNAINFSAPLHEGIIRIARAYTYMTLVDYWGDVPFDEALLGEIDLNPVLTDDLEVYNAALEELNLAIVVLENGMLSADTNGNIPNSIPGGSDVSSFFFENAATELDQASNWIKLANTLKFKYYLNLGDVAALNSLITENNMISNNNDSFAFRYQSVNAPESRNDKYVDTYGNITPARYLSNSYMFGLVGGHNEGDSHVPIDPRANYYFFRQTDRLQTGSVLQIQDALPCVNDQSPYPPGVPFCAFGNGYWGRDHGNSNGIPPALNLVTMWGVYPVGGVTDTGNPSTVEEGDGLNGAGVSPIFMAYQVDLMRAEAAFRLGTIDDAQTMLTSGIQKSIAYVTSFDGSASESSATYIANVMANYSSNEMQTIADEMWRASFGSGNEIYNMYRRTGFPNNLQPHLLGNGAGAFPRSLFYPTNTVILNINIPQKADLTTKVFWDNNGTVLQ